MVVIIILIDNIWGALTKCQAFRLALYIDYPI